MKNFLILALLGLYRSLNPLSPSKTDPAYRKYLIVSTTALGDTIWATPAIQSLKEAYPKCSINVLTSSIGEAVLSQNPLIDRIFTIKKRGIFPLLKLFPLLKKEKFETAFIFHVSQRQILPFCYMLGIPEIIGTAQLNKGLDSLLTTAVPLKKVHEVQRRLELVEAIGVPVSPKKLQLFFNEESKKEAHLFLQKHHIDPSLPLIALHPGAKDRFKQWDPSCFVKLGKKISGQLPCHILITGTAQEKNLVDEIASSIPGAVAITGELSLKSFAALISKLTLLVIGDTGPMHIAFSTSTPTIALFCATDPKLCGPHIPLENTVIHAKPPTCTPCLRKKCREPFCLLQFSPEEIFQSVLRLLNAKK